MTERCVNQATPRPHKSARTRAELFLRFFVFGLLTAPLTILVEFNLVGDGLLIFARPIVDTFALHASQFDKSIL